MTSSSYSSRCIELLKSSLMQAKKLDQIPEDVEEMIKELHRKLEAQSNEEQDTSLKALFPGRRGYSHYFRVKTKYGIDVMKKDAKILSFKRQKDSFILKVDLKHIIPYSQTFSREFSSLERGYSLKDVLGMLENYQEEQKADAQAEEEEFDELFEEWGDKSAFIIKLIYDFEQLVCKDVGKSVKPREGSFFTLISDNVMYTDYDSYSSPSD